MRSFRGSPSALPLVAKQRLWRHLQTQRSPQGGTLVNVIVALFGLGVLGVGVSAFILPQTLSCGNKARTAEARQMVGAMGRGQQAYYLEQRKFATALAPLGLGMPPETENYRYRAQGTGKAGFGFAEAKAEYTLRPNSFGPFTWTTNGAPLRSYVVGVFPERSPQTAVKPGQTQGLETVSILCEVEKIGPGPINPPIYQQGKLACGSGSNEVTSSLGTK